MQSRETQFVYSLLSGPQSIGARTNDEPLEAGVFVSDGTYISLELTSFLLSPVLFCYFTLHCNSNYFCHLFQNLVITKMAHLA